MSKDSRRKFPQKAGLGAASLSFARAGTAAGANDHVVVGLVGCGGRGRGALSDAIEAAGSTLLFTNTRSQAELWYEAIIAARPAWKRSLALHHGSVDRRLRTDAEEGLAAGRLRCVVCTSSLDLGVDFSPVDQVIQVGSPKGVARLLQRAGRELALPTVAIGGITPENGGELVSAGADLRELYTGMQDVSIEAREAGVERIVVVASKDAAAVAETAQALQPLGAVDVPPLRILQGGPLHGELGG